MEDAVVSFIGTEPVEVFRGSTKYVFRQNEISYIAKNYSRTEAVIKATAFQSPMSLREWEDVLDERMFFPVHRSYIVNLGKIKDIGDEIEMISGERLPIARRRRNELMQKYIQYDLRYR